MHRELNLPPILFIKFNEKYKLNTIYSSGPYTATNLPIHLRLLKKALSSQQSKYVLTYCFLGKNYTLILKCSASLH